MVGFVVITSLLNIAVGYWLAGFLRTGSILLKASTTGGAKTSRNNQPAEDAAKNPFAAIMASKPASEPASSPGLPTTPMDSSAVDAAASGAAPVITLGVEPTPTPPADQATTPTETEPTQTSAEQAEATEVAAEDDAQPAALSEANPTSENVEVEENVLAGIEAFRSQLAKMKEESAITPATS